MNVGYTAVFPGESMNVVCMIDKQTREETGDGRELTAGRAQEGGKNLPTSAVVFYLVWKIRHRV